MYDIPNLGAAHGALMVEVMSFRYAAARAGTFFFPSSFPTHPETLGNKKFHLLLVSIAVFF